MPFWIDEFIIVKSAVFARGWSSEQPVQIMLDGNCPIGTAEVEEREDLVPIYGDAARRWGFWSRAFFDVDQPHRRLAVRMGDQIVTADQYAASQCDGSSALLDQFRAQISDKRGRILEIGARARSGIVRREWFANCEYVGFDVMPGPNVDVVGDAHFLSTYLTEPFDGVISFATFEHLIMPWLAVAEINAVLRDGGLVFTHAPQTWPVHEAPWDFFRFSRDAWRGLFNEATGFEIVGSAMSEPAISTPLLQTTHGDATRIDNYLGYLQSVCLARKIGASRMRFDIAREMFDRIVGQGYYPG